ncbi:hypothetical protein GEMRC1_009653 [Eukaryota sp. GEM-RC1]
MLVFEAVLSDTLIPVIDHSHVIDVTHGLIRDCNFCDVRLLKIISALQFNPRNPVQKVNLSGNSIKLASLLTIFELASVGKLLSNIKISPHSIDVPQCSLNYALEIDDHDLLSLLEALKSSLPIKRVECCGLQSPTLKGILDLFEILSINKSVINIDVSPHFIDVKKGIIRYRSTAENGDLISILKAVKANIPIKLFNCFGWSSPNLEGLVTLFEIFSFSKSGANFDFSIGLSRYSTVKGNELFSVLNALESNVIIKRVDSRVLRNTNLQGLIALFEFLTVNKYVIDFDSTSHIVDVDNGVFCFSPESLTQISVDETFYLHRSLKGFNVKELVLRRCSFTDETITILRDFIRDNLSLTSVDFSFCHLGSNIRSILYALQTISCLKKINLSYTDISLTSLLNIFELISTNQFTPNIEISPHSFEFSIGRIHYENHVKNSDLLVLLNALKSNVLIKSVECRGLKSPSLKALITLFEILSINKSVIDLDISPHSIDIDDGVFCFSPESVTLVSHEDVSSLRTLFQCSTIKELSLKRLNSSNVIHR